MGFMVVIEIGFNVGCGAVVGKAKSNGDGVLYSGQICPLCFDMELVAVR
jgi:hypothetical protein